MNIDYFYNADGRVACQNRNGLTFYLEGQPPLKPEYGERRDYPTYPGDRRAAEGRHS